MCGRYVQTSSPTVLAGRFQVGEVGIDASDPDFNVAPGRNVPIVAEHDAVRVLERLRWGLVPRWAKDPSIGDRMINARAETVASKPAFKGAFKRRRCIIPADGFFEWQKVPGHRQKQPYFIFGRDRLTLAFAGLWEAWHDASHPDDAPLRSFAIITTTANATVAPVHDRMPVILPESSWDRWLCPENDDAESLVAMLAPAREGVLDLYPVSTAVNRPHNHGATLVEPITGSA